MGWQDFGAVIPSIQGLWSKTFCRKLPVADPEAISATATLMKNEVVWFPTGSRSFHKNPKEKPGIIVTGPKFKKKIRG